MCIRDRGKDIVQIIARLQERRDVGDTVSRIAAGGVDRFVVQPAGRQRLLQIEEHLVGIEGLMIGVETPGEIPSRQRLAVEGQLCPVPVSYTHLPRFGWRVSLGPLLAQYWQRSDPARRTPRWLRWHQRLCRRGEPRPLRLAPLHMDVHAGNIIHSDAGLKLIDWEYAGDGDIALELAAVWIAPDERRQLVAAYALSLIHISGCVTGHPSAAFADNLRKITHPV